MIWYCVDDVAWSTFFINITEDVIYKGVAPTCELGGWSDMREEIARVDYIKEFWSDALVFEFDLIRSVLKSPNSITSFLFSLVSLFVGDFKKRSLNSFGCMHRCL